MYIRHISYLLFDANHSFLLLAFRVCYRQNMSSGQVFIYSMGDVDPKDPLWIWERKILADILCISKSNKVKTFSSSRKHRRWRMSSISLCLWFSLAFPSSAHSDTFLPGHLFMSLGRPLLPRSLWVPFQGLLGDLCARFSEGVSSESTSQLDPGLFFSTGLQCSSFVAPPDVH